ncbi:MAG: hypothetical protein U0872_04715 [Planctomycetaceae bacterium]
MLAILGRERCLLRIDNTLRASPPVSRDPNGFRRRSLFPWPFPAMYVIDYNQMLITREDRDCIPTL